MILRTPKVRMGECHTVRMQCKVWYEPPESFVCVSHFFIPNICSCIARVATKMLHCWHTYQGDIGGVLCVAITPVVNREGYYTLSYVSDQSGYSEVISYCCRTTANSSKQE
jgi:hypothetical protein